MKFKSFAELSMKVGWEKTNIPIPTKEELQKAIEDKDEEKIMTWFRFSPSQRTKEEKESYVRLLEQYMSLIKGYSGTENPNPWEKSIKKETNGNKNA